MLRLRPAASPDEPFLRELVWLAVHWDADPAPALVPFGSELARYVEGFGSAGDWGVVAEKPRGRAVGAAWWRSFSAADPGYGFVADDVPELSIAVLPSHRGAGLGTRLLDALIAEARRQALAGLSLSVKPANPALGVYVRAGFEVVGDEGDAITMLRRLGHSP